MNARISSSLSLNFDFEVLHRASASWIGAGRLRTREVSFLFAPSHPPREEVEQHSERDDRTHHDLAELGPNDVTTDDLRPVLRHEGCSHRTGACSRAASVDRPCLSSSASTSLRRSAANEDRHNPIGSR